jgi:hypothetical protein
LVLSISQTESADVVELKTGERVEGAFEALRNRLRRRRSDAERRGHRDRPTVFAFRRRAQSPDPSGHAAID